MPVSGVYTHAANKMYIAVGTCTRCREKRAETRLSFVCDITNSNFLHFLGNYLNLHVAHAPRCIVPSPLLSVCACTIP